MPVVKPNRTRTAIDWNHVKTHRGMVYAVSNVFFGIAYSARAEILLRTGSCDLHSTFQISAGSMAQFLLIEAPTISSPGTPLLVTNNNRTSPNVSSATAFSAPTVTADGIKLFSFLTSGDVYTSPIKSGTEWVLKAATDYLVRVTNFSQSSKSLSIGIGFYEST